MRGKTTPDNRIATHIRQQTRGLNGFDYNAAAELFLSGSRDARSRAGYKRFDTAAEALRFGVESLPLAALAGAYLLVEEARFGADEIRYLYESAGYPLQRADHKE